MKYIIERKLYNREDIQKAMSRSIKSGDIKMNISFDEFVNKSLNLQKPEIGSFESMVKNGIISIGDETRMKKYITQFKKLGIDTSKLDKLYPDYQEYLDFPMDPPYSGVYDDESDHYTSDLDDWHDRSDELEDIRTEFNNEVMRLCEIAKEKLGFNSFL